MERICVKCFKSKDLEEYKKLHGDGYSNYCDACRGSSRRSMQRTKTKEERTAAHKEWRKDNPQIVQYRKKRNLMINHNLTPEQFDEMSEKQNHVCAICFEKHKPDSFFDRLVVDHNHETGEIRGLLCTNCNTAIGLMKDDPMRLAKAIEYLAVGTYEVLK